MWKFEYMKNNSIIIEVTEIIPRINQKMTK